MQLSRKKRGVGAVLVTAVVAGLVAALLTPAVGGASTPRVATASGGTITIAGMGFAKNFADAGVGAAARFQAANENKEVKGYTFDYKEFADDNNDPNTALSEARRLVTQEGILALVPAVSVVTPSDFLTQQQIPWFGTGYDVSYCTNGSKGFGLSAYGCLIPTNPKKISGVNWELLKTQLASKGIAKPTVALLGTDTTSGKQSVQNSASAAEGVGFKVVYAKGAFPGPPAVVGDYTPYAQALLESNDGKAPDVIYSSIAPTSALGLDQPGQQQRLHRYVPVAVLLAAAHRGAQGRLRVRAVRRLRSGLAGHQEDERADRGVQAGHEALADPRSRVLLG